MEFPRFQGICANSWWLVLMLFSNYRSSIPNGPLHDQKFHGRRILDGEISWYLALSVSVPISCLVWLAPCPTVTSLKNSGVKYPLIVELNIMGMVIMGCMPGGIISRQRDTCCLRGVSTRGKRYRQRRKEAIRKS